MKAESLQALLLDRELGELSPEAAELLDAWLAEHPQSAAAAPSLRQAVAATRAAVRRFPELARPEPSPRAARFKLPQFRLPSAPWFRWTTLAAAASLVLLLGAVTWLGFRAGQDSTRQTAKQAPPAPALHASVAKPSGPWARYALASGPQGLSIIRRDRNSQP